MRVLPLKDSESVNEHQHDQVHAFRHITRGTKSMRVKAITKNNLKMGNDKPVTGISPANYIHIDRVPECAVQVLQDHLDNSLPLETMGVASSSDGKGGGAAHQVFPYFYAGLSQERCTHPAVEHLETQASRVPGSIGIRCLVSERIWRS